MLRDSIVRVLDAIKWNLGRFPFVRTDRPADHCNHNENLTFYSKPTNWSWAYSKEMAFQQKLLEKSIFHCQNGWSGYDPTVQFWLFERALRFRTPILSGMPDFFWAQDSGFQKQKISQISEYGARYMGGVTGPIFNPLTSFDSALVTRFSVVTFPRHNARNQITRNRNRIK